MKVRKRKRRTPYQMQKDRTWRAFSRFIRTRDCLDTTRDAEWGVCVTCGNTYHFKDLQAGHYVPGRNNAVLFDEEGVHAQCRGCNTFGGGQPAKYHAYMLGRYGEKTVDRLRNLANESVKFTAEELREMELDFTGRTEALA